MGQFIVSVKDTVEDKLEAALKNIELWEELDDGGEYLISGFVKTLIQDALELQKSHVCGIEQREKGNCYGGL